MTTEPTVSFVIPARNERESLGRTLGTIRAQKTDESYEILVVDGASTDGTARTARTRDATVVEGPGTGIGHGRNLGANASSGIWLAFIDADTTVAPTYLDTMLEYVRTHDLVAATSRFEFKSPPGFVLSPGVVRTAVAERASNAYFRTRAWRSRPTLQGFNTFVERDAFTAVGGFPTVPNEDVAFSTRVAREGPTGVVPTAVVSTSPRRILDTGLTGTLRHYAALEYQRRRGTGAADRDVNRQPGEGARHAD